MDFLHFYLLYHYFLQRIVSCIDKWFASTHQFPLIFVKIGANIVNLWRRPRRDIRWHCIRINLQVVLIVKRPTSTSKLTGIQHRNISNLFRKINLLVPIVFFRLFVQHIQMIQTLICLQNIVQNIIVKLFFYNVWCLANIESSKSMMFNSGIYDCIFILYTQGQ